MSTDPRSILDYNGYRLGAASKGACAPFEWLKPAGPGGRRAKFASFDEFRRKTGLEAHGLAVDFDVFRRAARVDYAERRVLRAEELDLRLRPGSAPVDAGVRLPNVNDDFTGKAPDLGAYELGRDPPRYGPRTKRTLAGALEQAAAAAPATAGSAGRGVDGVTDANGDGVIETVTVGAWTVRTSRLITGTSRSPGGPDMSAVDNFDLTKGVCSPSRGEWTFDVVDFGGGLWRDTNGPRSDFFVFEAGGNDAITVAPILADGAVGRPVRVERNTWRRTHIASPVASGNAAGLALEVAEMLDAAGKPLTRATPIRGLRVVSQADGIDPLSVSAVAPKAPKP
jgi:hypothetical protein